MQSNRYWRSKSSGIRIVRQVLFTLPGCLDRIVIFEPMVSFNMVNVQVHSILIEPLDRVYSEYIEYIFSEYTHSLRVRDYTLCQVLFFPLALCDCLVTLW